MAISDHIEKAREGLRSSAFPSEAAVSQGVLLPALHELGWPVFNTRVVVPEFSLEGRRVDYALCHPANKPAVFVEVKKVGGAKGADKQLFEYAFHSGVPMAILTDGQEWSFYLPGEQGRYDERRVYKLDLLERNIEDATDRLERYLSYERVCSGEALRAARSDYQTVARKRAIENALPGAWSALLEEPDSPLLELLADKVEDLCGYKPELALCGRFLAKVSKPETAPPEPTTPEPNRAEDSRPRLAAWFVFKGETQEYRGPRYMLRDIFKLLAREDPDFPEKFAAYEAEHGKKRKNLVHDPRELFPRSRDRAEGEWARSEIAPGWWLRIHLGRSSMQNLLDSALEVVHPHLRSQIQFSIKPMRKRSSA